ncbi:DUF3078 domain-containing protein [Sphingobacterium sp. LRF_L2]|uniref:DUF3078 domain-containing protein n=1 Tax=Sphingobacterium sp. LRF_L2 TaxID=3369421 RepID=UPI003F61C15C
MRKLKIITGILSLLITFRTNGQESQNQTTTTPSDSTKNWSIKGENTFLINQSSFTNWSAGGLNSFAGNIVLNYDFNYAKGKWSWDNKVIGAYGLTFQKTTQWRKNDDRIILNSLLGYKAAEKWLYTFYANFNTQFTNGYSYDESTNEVVDTISRSFAPAYLSFGPGFAFKESDNFRINISPAAARFIIVGDEDLRTNYGVDVDKAARTEFGASLDAYYKVELMKNISFENILKLYSNYLEKPQNVDIDYTGNLFMKVNDYISLNAGIQLIYDDNTTVPKSNGNLGKGLQIRQIVGAGITYKF